MKAHDCSTKYLQKTKNGMLFIFLIFHSNCHLYVLFTDRETNLRINVREYGGMWIRDKRLLESYIQPGVEVYKMHNASKGN